MIWTETTVQSDDIGPERLQADKGVRERRAILQDADFMERDVSDNRQVGLFAGDGKHRLQLFQIVIRLEQHAVDSFSQQDKQLLAKRPFHFFKRDDAFV